MALVQIDVSCEDDAAIRVSDNMETCTLVIKSPRFAIEVEVSRDQLEAIAAEIQPYLTPIVEGM